MPKFSFAGQTGCFCSAALLVKLEAASPTSPQRQADALPVHPFFAQGARDRTEAGEERSEYRTPLSSSGSLDSQTHL